MKIIAIFDQLQGKNLLSLEIYFENIQFILKRIKKAAYLKRILYLY